MSTGLAAQMLDAITADFVANGAVFERNYDDLRYELEAQNDWATENVPGAEEVTLVQLLQASTTKRKVGEQDPANTYIHELIEYAFIEQEVHVPLKRSFQRCATPSLTRSFIPAGSDSA